MNYWPFRDRQENISEIIIRNSQEENERFIKEYEHSREVAREIREKDGMRKW